MGLSNVETILEQGVAGEPITVKPQSRVEKLLIDLINQGGGGGTTNYNALDNKPQIAGTTLQGDKSLADLGIASEDAVEDIYAVMGEMGAKNLIAYPYVSSSNSYFQINSDGSITLKGANTSEQWLRVSDFYLKSGIYTMTASPSGNAHGVTIGIGSLNDQDEYTPIISTTYPKFSVSFRINKGTRVRVRLYRGANLDFTNNVVLYPMLRLASDTDDTYQRYAKTNKQLTDEIANKVDKVEGKGLSSNDYTDEDKAIVANVEGKAEKTVMASGEALALVPTSEGKALIHTAYGMSVQNGTPTPSSPVDIESAKADFISTDGENTQNVTTNLTLRAIEVSSTDDYNLVRDNKYYIADTLDYSEDNGFVVTRRIKHRAFTADDGWTRGVYQSTTDHYSTPVSGIVNGKTFFMCNAFQVDSSPGASIGFANAYNSKAYFRYAAANTSTLEDWKQFVTDVGLYIDYVSKDTPTTESITTEQALALLSLKTYDESTSISSQAEPSCTVAIEYAKERLGALALTAHNLGEKVGGSSLSVETYQVTLDSDSYSKWGWVYVVDKNGNSVTPADGIFLRAWGESSNAVLTMDFVVLAEFGNRWMGRVRKVGNIADVTGFYGTMNFSFLRIS